MQRKQLWLVTFLFLIIFPFSPALARAADCQNGGHLAIVVSRSGLACIADGDTLNLYKKNGKFVRAIPPKHGISPTNFTLPVYGKIGHYDLYVKIGDDFSWLNPDGSPYTKTVKFKTANPCTQSNLPLNQKSPCHVYGPESTYTYSFQNVDPRIVVHRAQRLDEH